MTIISKPIVALLTTLLASTSFVDARRTLESKGGSRKNNKKKGQELRKRKLSLKLPKAHPSDTCIQKGYSIEPDFEEGAVNDERIYEDCCGSEWENYEDWRTSSFTFLNLLMQCETALEFDDKFQDCISKYAMTYPFHHWNADERSEFEFHRTGDAFIGETSFRGTMVPSPAPSSPTKGKGYSPIKAARPLEELIWIMLQKIALLQIALFLTLSTSSTASKL